jgi:hypothetical protein
MRLLLDRRASGLHDGGGDTATVGKVLVGRVDDRSDVLLGQVSMHDDDRRG